ncbi:hypothetical protein [Neobacillus vireti]|uniref:hypothetical protein n=1 Tax=Neobacillus vireti TaxID=220686 RepID=UPI002FFF038F
METKYQDPVTLYKEFERKCNKKIHTITNSLDFTEALGSAMERHLNHVETQQKIIKKWLTVFDIPNKDDIAALALRKIDCEEKIDNLEETIYILQMDLKKNNFELKKLTNCLKENLEFLEDEVKNVKVNKMKTLEMELEELKKLFTNKN